MKQLTFLFLLGIILLVSCNKNDFDLQDPDPHEFVSELKDGSYSAYAYSENHKKLWAAMPVFDQSAIPVLLEYARDTSLISPCDHFPVNPASSTMPFRVIDHQSYVMLGEYLLWCIEGIIKGTPFPSLSPSLGNSEATEYGYLSGKEVLEVRAIYLTWWSIHGNRENVESLPLDDSKYRWR